MFLRKQVASEAFPVFGFSGNLACELRAEEGRILSRWGDAGWGQKVADDKHQGHFEEVLVEAVCDMIRYRWKPDPAARWVTCVPSLKHTELVPDFSARVADKLGLPFIAAVRKIRQNRPQKLMQNRFHQCKNLDGAFEIENVRCGEPVLLIDDIVDSRWTMTIISALLLREGSGPVFPLALASTSKG